MVTTRFRLVKKKARPDGRAPLWLLATDKVTRQQAAKSTGIFLLPSEWDQKGQTFTNAVPRLQAEIWRRKLRELQSAFDAAELDARQEVRSKRRNVVTIAQVKALAITPVDGGAVNLTALAAVNDYVAWREGLRGTPGHEANTVRSVKTRLIRFAEWVINCHRRGLLVAELGPRHATSYVEYMRGRAKGDRPQAYISKCLEAVRACFTWHQHEGRLHVNPWASASVTRGTPADIIYLEPEEMQRLEKADLSSFPHRLTRARWLFMLSCYTGLAWADLKAFVIQWQAGEGLRTDAHGRRWLEFRRVKTRNESTAAQVMVPLLPGADKLLAAPVDLGSQRGWEETTLIGYATHRTDLIELGQRVGLRMELTTHVARKTFGMLLLNEGVPLETVSRLLGHSNLRTTQASYAKVLARRVTADLVRAGMLR